MSKSHKGSGIHTRQVWQALKHPMGRKLTWRSAYRMAFNWMQGKPIMRRPVLLKVLYKFQEELIHSLQADLWLELGSKNFQCPVGHHIYIKEDGDLGLRSDKDWPFVIDWKDESTWPWDLAFPETLPTSSLAMKPGDVPPNVFELTVQELADAGLDGIVSIASAADNLRETGQRWVTEIQKKIKHDDGYHGAFMVQRVERIALNAVSNITVRLLPYVLPGRYRARHYGRVRTKRDEYHGKYFYWGGGPGYNGHPCVHLPPGRPAWSKAQYIFKKRLSRWKRRKDKTRGKPWKRIKVKVPNLTGRHRIDSEGNADNNGRPKIGRRYRKRVGKGLVDQIKWSIEHPIKEHMETTEATLKRAWTKSAAVQAIKSGGQTYRNIGEAVLDNFKKEMIHDIADDICKNIKKFSKKRLNLYKKQVINSIADPALDYGIKVAVKVVRRADPTLRYFPVFDKHNAFDELLFQPRGSEKRLE